MSSNRYQYFRWTRRTALISFNYVILVPAIIGVAAYATDVRPGRPASDRHPPKLVDIEGWLIGDIYRASGTSGRSGRETCLLSTREAVYRRDEGGSVHQTGRKKAKSANICHQATSRFVLEDCYNLMPSHQNSMPNKTNRDIMIQQFRAF